MLMIIVGKGVVKPRILLNDGGKEIPKENKPRKGKGRVWKMGVCVCGWLFFLMSDAISPSYYR